MAYSHKHAFIVPDDEDPGEFILEWQQKEIQDKRPRYLADYLNEKTACFECYANTPESFLDAANSVSRSGHVVFASMQDLINSSKISEAVNAIEQKKAVIAILRPYMTLSPCDPNSWRIISCIAPCVGVKATSTDTKKEKEEPKIEEKETRGCQYIKVTNEQIFAMRKMREQSFSIGAIADEFKLSKSTVFKFVSDVEINEERRKPSFNEYVLSKAKTICHHNTEIYFAAVMFLRQDTRMVSVAKSIKILKKMVKITETRNEKTVTQIRDIDKESIDELISSWGGYAFYTAKRFFAMCAEKGLIERSPMEKMKLKGSKSKVVKSADLSEDELDRLIDCAMRRVDATRYKNGRKHHNVKMLMMLLIYSTTGVRSEEARSLKLRDVAVSSEGICTLTNKGKGNSSVIVPLSKELSHLLLKYVREYHQGSPESFYLFPRNSAIKTEPASNSSFRKFLKVCTVRAGIRKNVTTHSLRSTFATLAIKNGMSLIELQHRLSHATPLQTYAYIRRYDLKKENEFLPSFISKKTSDAAELI